MERHHLSHLADSWLDAIDPLERLTLITHLALEDHRIELAVFDSPDRHGIREIDWVNHLLAVVGGRRAPAVIAVVNRIPEGFDGAVAYAGHQQEHPIFAPAPQSLPEEPDSISELAASGETPVDHEAPEPGPETDNAQEPDTAPESAAAPAPELDPAPEVIR